MDRSAVGYAVLRDGRQWHGQLAGLQRGRDGSLTLARVPGPGDGQPIVHAGPYDTPASGVAVGRCRDVYIADTTRHSVSWIIGSCPEKKYQIGSGAGSAPGRFNTPRGLALGPGDLFVADSGNARIQVFRLPNLDLRGIWEEGLSEPTCLAGDGQGRLYVLDRGLKRILRFDTSGVTDAAYNKAMAAHAQLVSPVALAIDDRDVLYVSDEPSNAVLRFDSEGGVLGALPKTRGPASPRALAVHHDRLYVADAKSGAIHVYESSQGWLGTVPGYAGPVSAMALDEAGTLFIKPGLDDTYYELRADAAHVDAGALTAGPFDAGEQTEWERVKVEVDRPVGTVVKLRVYTASSATSTPSQADWDLEKTLAPTLDTLVSPLPGVAAGPPAQKRYLWIRVSLETTDPQTSPRLMQVRAHTQAESYLEHLPAVYRREDASQFLTRWLALFRGELSDWELALEELPRSFDPVTAAEPRLPVLSNWLAFDLPPDTDPEEWRQLLLRVHALYDRRGTPWGIREFAELYTGVRPHVFEAFHERCVWQVESTSLLGFDTALAAAAPDGMVVPGFVRAEAALMGLRGDYYNGTNFEQLKHTRIDAVVNFEWKSSPAPQVAADVFSVRWSGQLQPQYSEVYTFHTLSDDGVRLWVGGRLIIDNWSDHGLTAGSGRMALTAGRWYAITLEYQDKGGEATVRLAWSSLSQPKQVVPQERLYAIHDEGARLADGTSDELQETARVGQTVVGDSGPLAAADLGAPLFSDTAHLFTVVVPAGQIVDPARRERLTQVLEAEKPVHTDFHLCFVEARMTVGLQARVGVDSIVAGPRPPLNLGGTELGVDSYLGDDGAGSFGRLGQRSHVGQDTIVG